jgi:hypothetical protein
MEEEDKENVSVSCPAGRGSGDGEGVNKRQVEVEIETRGEKKVGGYLEDFGVDGGGWWYNADHEPVRG